MSSPVSSSNSSFPPPVDLLGAAAPIHRLGKPLLEQTPISATLVLDTLEGGTLQSGTPWSESPLEIKITGAVLDDNQTRIQSQQFFIPIELGAFFRALKAADQNKAEIVARLIKTLLITRNVGAFLAGVRETFPAHPAPLELEGNLIGQLARVERIGEVVPETGVAPGI